MLKKLLGASLALAVAMGASTADAALNAFMKIKNSKGQFITGGSTAKGREGSIVVLSSSNQVKQPRDLATGQASGKRQHMPFIVRKEVDRASPLLYQALVTNENLPEVELRYYHPSPNGTETNFYTVKLTDVVISDITFVQPNVSQADTRNQPEYEEISFTYRKIEWSTNEGTSAVDSR